MQSLYCFTVYALHDNQKQLEDIRLQRDVATEKLNKLHSEHDALKYTQTPQR